MLWWPVNPQVSRSTLSGSALHPILSICPPTHCPVCCRTQKELLALVRSCMVTDGGLVRLLLDRHSNSYTEDLSRRLYGTEAATAQFKACEVAQCPVESAQRAQRRRRARAVFGAVQRARSVSPPGRSLGYERGRGRGVVAPWRGRGRG